MSVDITFTADQYQHLLSLAQTEIESGAVLLAHLETMHDRSRLIVTDIIEVPQEAYTRRTWNALEITSEGYVHALKEAARTEAIAIWTHTHPGLASNTSPSIHDVHVNDELRDLFADRSASGHYGYLVIGHDDAGLTFTGQLDDQVIDRLSSIGNRFVFRRAQHSTAPPIPDLFSRNIKAFGPDIQGVISELTIAVVGAGGTGSAVAEQLVRLGVRKLAIIDPDHLSASNITRVYGSTEADVGRPKVDALGDWLQKIAPSLELTRIHGTITTESVARQLLSADIVFGCTDDNAGRLRLSRLPYFYQLPVIDCGVKLDSDEDSGIRGIFGRITLVYPGEACLICRDRIDIALATAEQRSAMEQSALEKEGYAAALPGVEPAVVAFTSLVAATSVAELLERLIGYGDSAVPSELILRIHDRRISLNSQAPTTGHYCDPHKPPRHSEMFLGLNWTS